MPGFVPSRGCSASSQQNQLVRALRGDKAKLGRKAAYGVGQHGLLLHQQGACRTQGKDALLLQALHGNECRIGAGCGGADRRGVDTIVLLAPFHEWPDRLGSDQLHLVAEATQDTGPVVRRAACLHDHGTARLLLKKARLAKLAAVGRDHAPGRSLIADVKLNDDRHRRAHGSLRGRPGPPHHGLGWVWAGQCGVRHRRPRLRRRACQGSALPSPSSRRGRTRPAYGGGRGNRVRRLVLRRFPNGTRSHPATCGVG